MRCLKGDGFTLIELVMLLAVLGLAGVAIMPRFNVGGTNVSIVARQIRSDILYTQEIAMSKFKAKSITFTPNQSSYSFSPSDYTDPPSTRSGMPAKSGVSVTSTSSGSGPVTFTFNSLGEPTAGAGAWVRLSGGGVSKTVIVQAGTGRAIIQ
jgi:type II secretory pathway pseudopilin PulG